MNVKLHRTIEDNFKSMMTAMGFIKDGEIVVHEIQYNTMRDSFYSGVLIGESMTIRDAENYDDVMINVADLTRQQEEYANGKF